jgi:preprotein translocase subunit SecD
VKDEFRDRMAELTRWEEGVHLATIADGEVLASPILNGPMRANGAITLQDERQARLLAARIGGGVLPAKPHVVEKPVNR